MACIKIVNVDFYMNPPIQELDVTYSEFRGSVINHVPIIRIFGSSQAGTYHSEHYLKYIFYFIMFFIRNNFI